MRNVEKAKPLLLFTRQNQCFEFTKEFAINFLRGLLDNITNSSVANALRKYFSSNKDAIYAKSAAQLDKMWNLGNKRDRRKLLRSKIFLMVLDESQARTILDSLDMDLLRAIYRSIRRSFLEVLPPSPRLSVQTRIKLMQVAIVANEPERQHDKGLEDIIRQRIRLRACLTLSRCEFPQEFVLEDFKQCSMKPEYANSPVLSLQQAPSESSLGLLMLQHIWRQQALLDTFEIQLRHGFWEKVVLKIGNEEIPFSGCLHNSLMVLKYRV